MKEKILEILHDEMTVSWDCVDGHEDAAIKLQKLFLSKQIELLTVIGLGLDRNSTASLRIQNKVTKLQSELKELQ